MSEIDIPLQEFSGYLKQVEPNAIGELARRALERAFPGFYPLTAPTEQMQEDMRKHINWGAQMVVWRNRTQRRYAGGDEFPRGRYYTLSHDKDGDDNGTLLKELIAYADPVRGGLFLVFDLIYEASVKHLAELGCSIERQQSLLLLFVGCPGAISPFIDSFSLEDRVTFSIRNQYEERVLVAAMVPYKVETRFVSNVLDLRQLSAQEWLLNEFALKDTTYFNKIDRTGITKFVHLLPTLLSAKPGGDHFTNALGVYCHTHGINALVFPSARANCRAVQKSGKLIDFAGWNLVDYRGAPEPFFKDFVDISRGWPQVLGKDVRVVTISSGEYSGSWRVEGLEEWYHELLTEQEKAFINNKNSKR